MAKSAKTEVKSAPAAAAAAPVADKKSKKDKQPEPQPEPEQPKKEKKSKKTEVVIEPVVEEEKKGKKEKKEKKSKKGEDVVEEPATTTSTAETKKAKKSSTETTPPTPAPTAAEKKTKKVEEPAVVVKKKSNHKPRDDSVDFEVKPSDPEWMTVDIKRLTRTRTMNFLAKWIQDSTTAMGSRDPKQAIVMLPFPHSGYQLIDIKIQPPMNLPPGMRQEFDNITNANKWQEAIRFFQIWSNNPTRLPLDFTSPTSDPTDPTAKFMFTHADVKVAAKAFAIVQDKRKKNHIFVTKLQAHGDTKRQLKQDGKWAPTRVLGGGAITPKSEKKPKDTMTDGGDVVVESAPVESEKVIDEPTMVDEDVGGKKDKKEKKEKKESKKDKKEKKVDEPVQVQDDTTSNKSKRKAMEPISAVEVEPEPVVEQVPKKTKRTKKVSEEEEVVQLPPPAAAPVVEKKKRSKKD